LENHIKHTQKIGRCLNQKSFKQYTTRVEQNDLGEQDLLNGTENMNVQFNLFFASTVVDVFEEILIFDEISLIGSLGGSLGLFIGFSFFGYISTLLQVIIDKMFGLSNKRINSNEIN
jgi:hypothetical protein